MIGSLLRRGVVRAIVGLTVAAVATAAGALYANDLATTASSPRPWFQLPFSCGESWSLETYKGHDDYDIDFIATDGRSAGRAILASAAGTVAWAGWSGKIGGVPAPPGTVGTDTGGGYGVTLEHDGGWFTVYGHMMAPPLVMTGQKVVQGQLLGNVGKTGATRTEHLHYEQFDDSRDPGRRRGSDKVEAYFNGIPSGITTDGDMNSGPLFLSGPKSPNQTRISANCGGPQPPAMPGPLLATDIGGAMRIHRWSSNGGAFTQAADQELANFDLKQAGDRIAAADVDGDGRTDLVTAHQNAGGSLSFRVQSGGGATETIWYTSATFNMASVAGRMVVADFTGDGKAEPALLMDTGNRTMSVVRWTSTGKSFDGYVTYPVWSIGAAEVADRVAAGDVDGDGRADLVLAHQKPDGSFGLSVLKDANNQVGTWYTATGATVSGVASSRLVVADFTGDGKAEPCLLVDRGNGTMDIVRWTSTGTAFDSQSTQPAGSTLSNVGGRVAAADVNGDRRADLIVAHQNPDATISISVFNGGNAPGAVWSTTAVAGPAGGLVGRLVVGTWSS